MNEIVLVDDENIKNEIFNIRDLSVMMDRNLTKLYCVEKRRLNE